jgi:hypothetical protein
MSLTAIGFVLVFVAAIGLSLIRHPIYGLFAYMWAFYNNPVSRWWGQDLPDLRWSLSAAIVTLVSVGLYKARRPAPARPTPGVAR